MLTQVVYTSRPKFDPAGAPGKQMLETIVAAARRNNHASGITGFLVVGQDRLAQILEGDSASVGKTLKRILADPRHEAVQLVDMRLVPDRRFGDWAMGMSNELNAASATPASQFERLSADDFVALAQSATR